MFSVAGFPSVPSHPLGQPSGVGCARFGGRRGTHLLQWVAGTAARVALLLLAGYHTWLFGDRLFAGTFLDPMVAVRWAAGVALAFGFLWLRRCGLPLLCGRRAVVLWLLVALLHVHAAWAPPGPASEVSAREAAVLALQAVSAAAVALGFGLLAVLLRVRLRAPRPVAAWLAEEWLPSPASTLSLSLAAPRPPPAR